MIDILADFTVLDLETTGLDPSVDRIVEVGMVRIRDGQVETELSRLVDPQRPIPPHITRLTGIADGDVREQPTIEALLPELLEFIGRDALVAHNAPFDFSFLTAAVTRGSFSPLENTAIDTLLLSCILLPCLRDHRLATLVEYYGISHDRVHRALDDARATAQVYLYLAKDLVRCDPGVISLLSRLSSGAENGMQEVFVQGLNQSIKNVLGSKIATPLQRRDLIQECFNLSGATSGETLQREVGGEPQPLDLSFLESLFGPQTPLGQVLGHYEQRPQQIRMIRAVARAFNQGEFLAVEAGTGIGKSLAYLVPAIHWAVQNRERVIISTHTKNLQEQLFYKDIPLLHRALQMPFVAALVKGRSNYLCLRKWDWVISQAEQILTAQERRDFLTLVLWVQQTHTGDMVENTGFKGNMELWSKVCAERNECLGPRCRYHGSCFLMKIRRAAVGAHLVVVNHSLFFSDLAADGAVLSNYDFVVFDEAHRLEEVATQYLGTELNWWTVRVMLNRLMQRGQMEVGTLPALESRVKHSRLSGRERESLLEAIGAAVEARHELWRTAVVFFQDLTEIAVTIYGQGVGDYSGKYRYRPDGQLLRSMQAPAEVLTSSLVRLKSQLRQLGSMLELIEGQKIKNGEQLIEELMARARDCGDLIDSLDHLISAEEENSVYWVETPTRENSFDSRLFSAPLNVSQLMRTLIYGHLWTAVHTSATLTVAGRFDYFLDRIGLNLVEPERLHTLSAGSPFDFEEQALVCVPMYLPTPRDSGFVAAVIETLRTALLASRGGALVLFTSYEMLGRTYEALANQLGQEGILVLGQGRDGSRTNILNRFRGEKEAVLMGTSSFWEGVDIPGDSLRMLILVKLPFQVPTEPIVEAHMEQLEKQGRNAFNEYLLPEAVVRFRQGFGRLIRRADDRGVVLILDRRVLSTHYGATFLRSLPTRTWALDSPQVLEEDIRRWFESEKKPPLGGPIPLEGSL